MTCDCGREITTPGNVMCDSCIAVAALDLTACGECGEVCECWSLTNGICEGCLIEIQQFEKKKAELTCGTLGE